MDDGLTESAKVSSVLTELSSGGRPPQALAIGAASDGSWVKVLHEWPAQQPLLRPGKGDVAVRFLELDVRLKLSTGVFPVLQGPITGTARC